MSKATITFDLSIPEDAFEYKCAMKGYEACMLLESLKNYVRAYQKYDILAEVTLQRIIEELREWEDVNT
jgi:NADPH-dependent 7-cyano-7-deazaguanine reductase QueF